MAADKQQPQAAVEAQEDEEVRSGKPIGSWEFIDTPPTAVEVKELLETLPDVWGIRHADFVEYVQPLSQNKDLSVVKGTKDYHQVWNLYFTVAGRIAMLNQAAIENEWVVSFEPEEFGERHGYVEYGPDRLVYREYCHIQMYRYPESTPVLVEIGRRPGIAWVPMTGGSGAVASNRFEKVETSARGRAIAAWGFGVIPGSGVASFDEMLMINDGRAAGRTRGQQQDRPPAQPRISRDDMLSRLRVGIETLKREMGITPEQSDLNTVNWVRVTFAKELVKDEGGAFDFSALKDGEIALFLRTIEGEVNRVQAQQSGLA